jgi:hypothetical protein
VLTEIGAKWHADQERQAAERHARGEYTFVEIVLNGTALREGNPLPFLKGARPKLFEHEPPKDEDV